MNKVLFSLNFDKTNNNLLFFYRLAAFLAKLGNRIINRSDAVSFKNNFGQRRTYPGVVLTRAKRRMIDFYSAFDSFDSGF